MTPYNRTWPHGSATTASNWLRRARRTRKSCYFFVRPKRKVLEVCVFLGRPLKSPAVKRVVKASSTKHANMIHIRHRDEVESPITDWLQEAYALQDAPARVARKRPVKARPKPKRRK